MDEIQNNFADLLKQSIEADIAKIGRQIEYKANLNQPAAQQSENIKFPVSVFPEKIVNVINATNATLLYEKDFIAASILYAASVAIGNTSHVEIKNGYRQNAVLYMAIVGKPGSNKTHPLSFALNPISERDTATFKDYKKEYKEYERVSAMSKKARQAEGLNEPIKPEWVRYIIKDFTPEALASIMGVNQRGLGAYVDELIGWLNNMDRYNNGSAQEFFLSSWSGVSATIDRKTSGPILISMPFVSVAGTIQPGILKEFAKQRTSNGFLDRVLFVTPKDTKKPYWSEEELSPDIISSYSDIISKILDLPLNVDCNENPQPDILRFSSDAMNVFRQWQRVNADECNEADNESIGGVISKMEMYAARFALILQLLKFACGEGDRCTINKDSIQGAILMVDYFKKSAIRVHGILSGENIIADLPADKQQVYSALPDSFKTNEGFIVADSFNMPQRTYDRFIKDNILFKKLSRGEYQKLH